MLPFAPAMFRPEPLEYRPMAAAWVPDEAPLPLIPKPRLAKLDYQHPVELTGAYTYPVGRVRFWTDFTMGLANRFQLPKAAKGAKAVGFDAGVSKLGKRPGAYEITIRPNGRISVLGEEDEGLRNGLRRLAMMAYAKNGKLLLPTGSLVDEPAITWRGVHLFVGPEAPAFQRRLWERVLLPLGMNKVVLQCERTQWKTTPIDASEKPMSREDLADLFAYYRKAGVEPIPLIQSIGHMGWFFAGGQRRDLAVNPDTPFTLDYRKPESIVALRRLCVEATELLKPTVIHFGGDEIDLRGFPDQKEALTTEIWQKAMPELKAIADSSQAKMMIWGDEGLGPKDAVDATNGVSDEIAQRRRAAIPPGTWIADWHYKDDPRPELFYPSLQLWRREGFRPVASGWFRPNNVRGFALAATLERVGYLQTTWAGYQSSQEAMEKNLSQFGAMVMAADYTWSARQDPVDALGYQPDEIFRKLFYGQPSPLKPVAGKTLGTGPAFAVGSYGFRRIEPTLMASTAGAGGTEWLPVPKGAHRAVLALEVDGRLKSGEVAAEILLRDGSGRVSTIPLRYCIDVRSTEDLGPVRWPVSKDGIHAVEVPIRGSVNAVTIKPLHPQCRVNCFGVTVL